MDADVLREQEELAKKFVADLFRGHGIECTEETETLVFEKEAITAEIRLFDRTSQTETKLIQLDARFKIGIDCDIIESVVGFGDDYAIAVKGALENFTHNSFHVLLSAFYTPAFDDEIKKYNWEIGGKLFDVTMSNIGVRGKLPDPFSTQWLDQFEKVIQKQYLSEGIHWVRLFYAQHDSQMSVCEVLLDNDVWEDVLKDARKFDWPKSKDFFSVRIFMVLINGFDIRRIAGIIGTSSEYDELHNKLSNYGLSDLEIEKAYSMIPEAFGRAFVESIGKGRFEYEAAVINESGEQFNIDLRKEPYYINAYKLAKETIPMGLDDNAKNLVFMSAALNTFDSALKGGEKPEDIDCNRFSLIFNIPLYKKDESVRSDITSDSTINKEKKPFWKFWK